MRRFYLAFTALQMLEQRGCLSKVHNNQQGLCRSRTLHLPLVEPSVRGDSSSLVRDALDVARILDLLNEKD